MGLAARNPNKFEDIVKLGRTFLTCRLLRSCAGPTVCIGYDRKLYCRPTDTVSSGTLPTPYRLYSPYVTWFNKSSYPTEILFSQLGA